MTAKWTRRAERSLYEIADYIALDDPVTALAWIEKLRARANRAAAMPGSGRVVPELARDDVREVLLGNDRIIYRSVPRMTVLVVLEGHRQLAAAFDADD